MIQTVGPYKQTGLAQIGPIHPPPSFSCQQAILRPYRFYNVRKKCGCPITKKVMGKAPIELVPILLRKSAIFRCPLCAQLFLCLCFPKVVIFDFHFSTMNDDLYGQVESKSSLWYKNQTIWLKNG